MSRIEIQVIQQFIPDHVKKNPIKCTPTIEADRGPLLKIADMIQWIRTYELHIISQSGF